ncbi:MAG: class I SAM-dependent methyltransferase [Bacillota bacterium]
MNSVNYFDSIAHKWNVIRSEYFEEELKQISLSKVDISNKICVDLGCGTGFISLSLAEKAKMVFSLDCSRNMLKELSNSAREYGYTNIYPLMGTMDDIPLFDKSTDAVFVNMALHHVENVKQAIKEMYRVLKNNGSLVITDVEEHNGYWAIEEMHDVWMGFSRAQILRWLEEAGFKDIEVYSIGLMCKGYSSKGEYTETGIFLAKGIKREE